METYQILDLAINFVLAIFTMFLFGIAAYPIIKESLEKPKFILEIKTKSIDLDLKPRATALLTVTNTGKRSAIGCIARLNEIKDTSGTTIFSTQSNLKWADNIGTLRFDRRPVRTGSIEKHPPVPLDIPPKPYSANLYLADIELYTGLNFHKLEEKHDGKIPYGQDGFIKFYTHIVNSQSVGTNAENIEVFMGNLKLELDSYYVHISVYSHNGESYVDGWFHISRLGETYEINKAKPPQ